MIVILHNIRDPHARERFWFQFVGLLALLFFCSIILGVCIAELKGDTRL